MSFLNIIITVSSFLYILFHLETQFSHLTFVYIIMTDGFQESLTSPYKVLSDLGLLILLSSDVVDWRPSVSTYSLDSLSSEPVGLDFRLVVYGDLGHSRANSHPDRTTTRVW